VLAAQAETLDQRAVTLDVGVLQVVQQATTLADKQQQATTAVVVVLVLLQVTRQVRDTTSGDPVSPSLSAYCLMMSSLATPATVGAAVFFDTFLLQEIRCTARPGTSTGALSVRGRSHGNDQTISARGAGANR
jgi:hypothetical protein